MIYKYVFDLLYYNNIYHTFDSLASASKQVVEIIIEILKCTIVNQQLLNGMIGLNVCCKRVRTEAHSK
jgi:hypothetical protein